VSPVSFLHLLANLSEALWVQCYTGLSERLPTLTSVPFDCLGDCGIVISQKTCRPQGETFWKRDLKSRSRAMACFINERMTKSSFASLWHNYGGARAKVLHTALWRYKVDCLIGGRTFCPRRCANLALAPPLSFWASATMHNEPKGRQNP
jgi:hypothetical protein